MQYHAVRLVDPCIKKPPCSLSCATGFSTNTQERIYTLILEALEKNSDNR